MSDLFWFTDAQWGRIEAFLPRNTRGMNRVDDRRVLSWIVHVLKSGGHWGDAPADYGPKESSPIKNSRTVQMLFTDKALMPEVADTRKDHGKSTLIGGFDYVFILYGPPGLDNRCGPRIGGGQQSVREGEEGIRGHDRTCNRCSRFSGLPCGDAARINAGHLPCANADGL